MCLIETPPTERLPVQTYVTEYDGAIVRDAIMREKRRGGQVFFVYNRVATMERMKVELEALVPEVTVGMAHGQMTGAVLEANMFDFYEGEYDVLLWILPMPIRLLFMTPIVSACHSYIKCAVGWDAAIVRLMPIFCTDVIKS